MGRKHNVRFPQTRMGVEQVYYDGFMRAKDMRMNGIFNALLKK